MFFMICTHSNRCATALTTSQSAKIRLVSLQDLLCIINYNISEGCDMYNSDNKYCMHVSALPHNVIYNTYEIWIIPFYYRGDEAE